MNDLTKKLVEMFPNGGYFVEAGAHDGIGDSQTYELEQLGWNGLCVEPSSAFHGLTESRRCRLDNRCLWDHNGLAPFTEISGNDIELSGISGSFNYDEHGRDNLSSYVSLKQAVTLTAMLKDHDAPSVIEFLALDTEGSELAILSVHDFERYRFLFMEIEYHTDKRREELTQLLVPKGYQLHSDDAVNLFLTYGREI